MIVTTSPARHAHVAGRHSIDRAGTVPVSVLIPNPPSGQPGRHRASIVVRAFRVTSRVIGRTS